MFSDTVNTGHLRDGTRGARGGPAGPGRWTGPPTSSPSCSTAGAPLYGYVSDSYWEDVGTHESYLKAQADVLAGRVQTDIAGFEVSPGVWVAEGAEVDTDAVLTGPLCIGDYAKIEAGAHLREYTVIGSNVVVKEGAFLHRAVVHNNVYVGQGVTLRGCVIGKNTDVMRLGQDRGGRRRRGRVRDRARGVPVRRGEGLPVQDHRGGRGGQHQRDLGVQGAAHPVRPARGVRPDQRGDHPRAGRPAGQRLRHHAAQGLHRHHLAGRVPGRPRRSSARCRARSTPARSTSWTWRSSRCPWRGSRPPGTTTAAASRCAPRPATRSRSTSSSWTSAAPSCPRRTGASWSGSSPGRSSGGPSPARSPS